MSEPDWLPRPISPTKNDYKALTSGVSDILGHRPVVATSMARIITTWSEIDRLLTEAFAYLVNAEKWIAAETFEKIGKTNSRVRLMLPIIQEKFGVQAKERAEAVLYPAVDLQGYRDDIAHGTFAYPDEDVDTAIRIIGWGARESWFLYDRRVWEGMTKEFYERGQAVSGFATSIIVSTPPRYEKGRKIFAGPHSFREPATYPPAKTETYPKPGAHGQGRIDPPESE